MTEGSTICCSVFTIFETISYINKDIKLGLNYAYPISKFHRVEWGGSYNYLARRQERYDEESGIDYSSTIRKRIRTEMVQTLYRQFMDGQVRKKPSINRHLVYEPPSYTKLL